jgi:hypothetical protein
MVSFAKGAGDDFSSDNLASSARDLDSETLTQLQNVELTFDQVQVSNCLGQVQSINHLYQTLPKIKTSSDLSEDQLSQIQNTLWLHQLRLKDLNDRLKRQNTSLESGRLRDCTLAVFDTMQVARVTANYYAYLRFLKIADRRPELAIKLKNQNSPFALPGLQLQVNENYRFKDLSDLRSGDVILNRSASEALSYYALQGAHYQTLTHASIIYKPTPDRTLLIESQNSGLSFIELKPDSDYFKRNYLNILVLRHHNEVLASKAANIIFNIAKNYSPTGKSGSPENFIYNLPYRADTNFEITDQYPNPDYLVQKNLKKNKNRSFNLGFSCVEAIRAAFRFASNELNIPMTPIPEDTDVSRAAYIAFQNPKDKQGTPAIPINFIEIDQKFSIVAEWKSFAQLKASNDMDIAIENAYNELFSSDSKFAASNPLQRFLIAQIFDNSTAYTIYQFYSSLVKGLGISVGHEIGADFYALRNYPDHIAYTVVNSYIMMRPRLDFVQRLQSRQEKMGLLPLTAMELRSELETARWQSLKKWRDCRVAAFHNYLYTNEHRDCAQGFAPAL